MTYEVLLRRVAFRHESCISLFPLRASRPPFAQSVGRRANKASVASLLGTGSIGSLESVGPGNRLGRARMTRDCCEHEGLLCAAAIGASAGRVKWESMNE